MDEHGPETEDELKAELIVVLRRADIHLSSSQIAAAMGEAMAYFLSDDFVDDDENLTEAQAEEIAKAVREAEPEATAQVLRELTAQVLAEIKGRTYG
jgi:hypothetical protein